VSTGASAEELWILTDTSAILLIRDLLVEHTGGLPHQEGAFSCSLVHDERLVVHRGGAASHEERPPKHDQQRHLASSKTGGSEERRKHVFDRARVSSRAT
jgi:hypothetical protein